MRLADFDYHLPEAQVAQAPVTPRDASRLLVLPPEGPPAHRRFADLPEVLRAGDLLVFNDTRVIPARLLGRKPSGGRVELLLCEPLEGGLGRRWRALGQASKPIRAGAVLEFDGLSARVDAAEGEGFYAVTLDREGAALEEALARAGRIPLPPYIRREPSAEDAERYQTIWARRPGSAAAPTAGLHFTAPLLAALEARGVQRTAVTLHVGPGTFLPVRGEALEEHRMHAERYAVPDEAAAAIAQARARGGRVVAVGTTTVRTLESAWSAGEVRSGEGRTEIFIRPGHAFRAVDALVTNFHLPRSTLLILVCAFGGTERVLSAYREAVTEGYRFFSYGDAMVVIPR
ncbi:MAG TPA: tRNA preQ1(34) S-adenosylmethionine ribosyltransferase-isomerase QueA [Anaeromyxobacter sp.]|nr:tRNA preQ1(34) S-adenosylmethionine ribosyltransferase-isomerase QueA [Anaeromyxobacter sp.]